MLLNIAHIHSRSNVDPNDHNIAEGPMNHSNLKDKKIIYQFQDWLLMALVIWMTNGA